MKPKILLLTALPVALSGLWFAGWSEEGTRAGWRPAPAGMLDAADQSLIVREMGGRMEFPERRTFPEKAADSGAAYPVSLSAGGGSLDTNPGQTLRETREVAGSGDTGGEAATEGAVPTFRRSAPGDSEGTREEEDFQPLRTLPVPTALAGEPLPFFLTAAAVGTAPEKGIVESKPVAETPDSTGMTPAEEKAVEDAARAFADAMEAAPTKDETDPVYEDWWRASRQRAEERLRTALGWDRFNRLSISQARELSINIGSGR